MAPTIGRNSHGRRLLIGLGLAALGGAGLGLLAVRQSGVAPPAGQAGIAVRTATEATVASHVATQVTVFRLLENPRIIIVDYPTLMEQGLAMNRVAAFIEKADTPRDRVLEDAALRGAIEKAGETIESYYYGHDYSAADLRRFFAAADDASLALNPAEGFIRRLAGQEGFLEPGVRGGLLTLPQPADPAISAHARRVILRHELSHGAFFANPGYADFVRQAWTDILSAEERHAFQAFLGRAGYDVTNHDLLVNEMQAFLMFTPDPRYSSAEIVGLPEPAWTDLRRRFGAAMPHGWLRDLANAPLPPVPVTPPK